MATLSKQLCGDCATPLYPNNLTGYCARCRKYHVCRLCRIVMARRLVGYCAECQRSLHASHVVCTRYPGIRPEPEDAEELVAYYAARAAARLPLFTKNG